MNNKLKYLLFIIGIIAIVGLALEISTRSIGMVPGIYYNIISPVDIVEDRKIFEADSFGISKYAKNSDAIDFTLINNLGFPSPYDFVAEEQTPDIKRVMIVGDSYVNGCCAEPMDSSFTSLLDLREDIKVFNFGIGGTDPVQYRLILENYINLIRPDIVIVGVYLGNDILPYERIPRPNIPNIFAIKDCGWLASEIYDGEKVVQFENAQEAYDWYYRELTILGPKRTVFQKVISKSSYLSSLYFKISLKKMEESYNPKVTQSEYCNKEVERINEICKSKDVDYFIVGIPSPIDIIEQPNLDEKYGFVFKDIVWYHPDISTFTINDYDGKELNNHFNNSGHKKFYYFLKTLLNN